MTKQRAAAKDEAPLARFLEKLRRSFAHDLNTPLGAISNYASVLESSSNGGGDEVRDLGRRIRNNAKRASRMLQLLATTTALASRPAHAEATDIVVLVQSIFSDAGSSTSVRLSPSASSPLAHVDAEVAGFVLRAYVAVALDAHSGPVDAALVTIADEPEHVRIGLTCGAAGGALALRASDSSADGLQAFLMHDGGPNRNEVALGLGLAEILVGRHGGVLEVAGVPGSTSYLQLRFERSN